MIQDIAPHFFDNAFRPTAPHSDSIALIFQGDKIFLLPKTEYPLPCFADLGDNWQNQIKHYQWLFRIDEQDVFCCELMGQAPADWILSDLRICREMKPDFYAFAAITGAHLYRWYMNNIYCGHCGHMMQHSIKERALCCPDCNNLVYPRINPAIIVAVTNGDRLLMVKGVNNISGRYSLVAGFVEIGETFEDTVRREVWEEVGLKVKNIRYYKSQPWAFSDSEMIGFFAELDGDDTLTCQEEEIVDAKWVPRDQVPLPQNYLSISQELIEAFIVNK